MAVLVKIVSADGKVTTKLLPGVPSKTELPEGATVEVIGQQNEGPARQPAQSGHQEWADRKRDEDEEENYQLAFDEPGENAAAEETIQAELVSTGEFASLVTAMESFADGTEREVTYFAADDDDSFLSGSNALLWGALGLAGIVGVVLVVKDDDDSDSEPPAAPTGLDLAAADDNGDLDNDNLTSQTSDLTISGSAEGGATVELFDGSTSLGTMTADATGAFILDVDLAEGVHTITAVATDEVGNESTASSALTITVDATAPAVPAILDLAAEDDTGSSNSDNVTNKTSSLTFTGTTGADAIVELFDGSTSLGTATANSTGSFSIDVNLAAGAHTITARATDAAGNTSAASSAVNVTVDATAPSAPSALDLSTADDDGNVNDDNVTTITSGLTISGTAQAGSTVQLLDGSTSLGAITAGQSGSFTFEASLGQGTHQITAVATDSAGNVSVASAPLAITVVDGPQLVNASVDGLGDTVTLYFDVSLDDGAIAGEDFTVDQGGAQTINEVEVVGNRVILHLDAPLADDGATTLSFSGTGLEDTDGFTIAAFSEVAVSNRLDLEKSAAINFSQSSTIQLEGAEISAFDPASGRIFITGADGIQVVQLGDDLSMTLLGTIPVGTNNVTSVSVGNGIVAATVVADDKTLPGKVYFIDADGAVDASAILGNVDVGSLPDMVTFTPDGTKVLVANEAELDEDGNDPVGSVSIIDISAGVASATVATAGFEAFNSQVDALKAAGVRLFAGEQGFENTTVAQDLEPEYIAVSADGTTAFVTLQENNAIAIVDVATATVTDIVPLGLKSFKGLLADFTDEDDAIGLTTGNPVFGQFMPDSISSFTGGDGKSYYVIANEGDDRDDFLPEFLNGFEESTRVEDLTLDPAVFPNAAALQDELVLGRLGVSQAPGNDGDIDGDGDVDQLLAYGARSFSILDSEGNIIFDSGSHIEEFVALGGFYDAEKNTGLFDDRRSDNKGPEPEGITTGVFGDSVLAFVALERGGGGVMVYDVTDPLNVTFVQYVRHLEDISPEGLVYVKAEDSPSGEPLLLVANEVSATLTAYEITDGETYTLQLLHFADGEAKNLAIETAPNLAALVDAFEDDYVNSITLAGGDNYIPGLFFTAQTDSSITSVLPGGNSGGRVDIAIHNAIGVQTSTIGNHEFDKGSSVFAGAIAPSGAYEGALFPYLSANLDFSGDSSLNPLFQETLGTGLEYADELSGKIVPSVVIEENGELIGVVGATTQVLASITSLGGTIVKGTSQNDMELLALQLQPYIDDLIEQGVNKIILTSHLQQLELEQELALLLEGVDIIVAAGSNARLADDNDALVAFTGHAAVSEGDYPIITQGLDGKPTLIVNTDNEYTYLGRLVVEFDAEGVLVLDGLDSVVNGAYAATAENVAEAWGTTVDNLDGTAFADGTRGDRVQELVDAVNAILEDQGSNVYGFSDVYLEGERAVVRSQESNLGNLTADANAFAAREALGLDDDVVVVSIKNGGGIRASIGSISGTGSNVVLGPNDGGVVTELDTGAALAFNNGLMVFDTTPQGLLNILNSPVTLQAGNGGFLQIGGLQVSYDPDLPAGNRVIDIALVDADGDKIALVDDGVVVAGAPTTITAVVLNFTANGGDQYAIKANGENFRFLRDDGTISAPVDESLNFTADGVVPANILGEQQAFADYLGAVHGTVEEAFDKPETPAALDERIQNVNVREDTVLDGVVMTSALMVTQVETFMAFA